MLGHDALWDAIDRLAASRGLSVSALARAAGLDPTALNRSKRVTAGGRPRWPSTASLSRLLEAAGVEAAEFFAAAGAGQPTGLPLLGYAEAGRDGYFDDAGYPLGDGWERVAAPAAGPGCYALRISGDSMAPVWRAGDLVILDPGQRARPGDRVVVRTRAGEVMGKELAAAPPGRIRLKSLNPAHDDRDFAQAEIEWMARVIWVSQ